MIARNKSMKKRRSVLLISLLIAPVPANGQEQPTSLETTVMLDEVVVTATKTVEKRKDVPNAVIIKNAQDLEDAPAQGIGELLANEPGLDWRTYGNYGGATQAIHIRGMGGDATQVFLNGINLNSPTFASADIGRLPTNSIEKIEVIKGSGSLLYGTGAMGGTVQLLTKNPQHEQMTARATAGYGTEESYELAAEHGMFVTETLGYYLTATSRETDGFRDNSDLEHKDLSCKLLFDAPELMQISLFSAYIDREYGLPGVKPPEGTAPHLINSTLMYNDQSASLVNRGEDEDWHNVLELTAQPWLFLNLTMRADYSDTESYNLNRYNSSGTGVETWVTNTTTGIEGFLDWHPLSQLAVLAGGQYRDYDSENKQGNIDAYGAAVAGSRTLLESSVYTRGAYSEIQYRPLHYIKLLAGLRHEQHSTAGSESIPRFGLVINPYETTAIKLSHGKHFRAPSINDLFWPDDGFTKGNTALIAETGWHSDVTIEQSLWQERIMATLSAFRTDTDDKITWAEDPADPNTINWGGYWKPSNVNQFTSRGVELGLTVTPVEPLHISLAYTYVNAEEEKVDGAWRQATNTADNTFKVEAGYLLPFGLYVDMVVRYVDERPSAYATDADLSPEHVLPSYWTADIKLSQNLGEHWLLTFTATNLFDTEYDTNSSDFYGATYEATQNAGYPGAGRSLFASLSYEF